MTFRKTIGMFLAVCLALCTRGVYAQETSCEDICSHPDLTVSYEECLALATFYVTQGGNSWNTHTNWTTSPDVSTRRGVGVATGNQIDTVTNIVLPNNGLSGVLGNALIQLPNLTRLDLQHNALTSIDSGWATMTQLEELILAHNDITTLPNIFTNWGSLDVLRLEGNELSSLPSSIGQLYELDMLDLSDNKLTTLPANIGNLDDLDILKVARNQLSVLPDPISDLAQLSLLDAQGNMLTVRPAQMDKMSNLESLQLQQNRFTTIPAEVFALPSLYYLNMRYNLIETLPGGWEGSETLQLIDLGNNRLDTLPEAVGVLPALKQLYLHNNRFVTFPEVLFSLDTLELLGLGLNYLEGDLPNELSSLQALSYLDVSYNRLSHHGDGGVVIPAVLQSWADRAGFVLVGQGQAARDQSWIQGETDIPSLVSTGVRRNVTLHPTIYGQLADPSVPVLVVGGDNPLCAQLQVALTYNGTGTYELSFDPQVAGVYEGCTLQLVTSQGDLTAPWNIPTITMVTQAQAAFCDDPALTVTKPTCLALLQFFVATNGTNWKNNTGWFVNPQVQNWYGLQTQQEGTTYRITGLLLHTHNRQSGNSLVQGQGNGLVGVLPDIFVGLPDLKIISVGNNTLSGPLPASLRALPNLEELYMQKNKLSGSLTILGGLTSLRRIGLQGNAFAGPIEQVFVSLPHLEAVDLRDNDLSGSLPMFHAQAPLWYVNLGNNAFDGTMPEEWKNVSTLQHLALQGNNIVGTIPASRAQRSGITHVDVSNNALDREVTNEAILSSPLISRWSSRTEKNRSSQRDIQAPEIRVAGERGASGTNTYLLDVQISENNYAVDANGQGLVVVWGGGAKCELLSSEDIRIASGSVQLYVNVSEPGLYEGCTVTVLDHGKNFSTPVEAPILAHELGDKALCLNDALTIPREECFALRDLYTTTHGAGWTNKNNRWQTPNVGSWFGIQTAAREGKQHVTSLLLHRNELTSPEDALVPQAQGNNLSGSLPSTLRDLIYLEKVRLDHNTLSGTPRDALVGMDYLTTLTLAHNGFSDLLPAHWGTFSDLEYLDLSHNVFSGSLPSSRKGMKNLKSMRLAHNKLSGTIELSATDWGLLEEVDLSANVLSGTLDPDWSKQLYLKRLLLAGNDFGGPIPHAWSVLTGLEEVDLSENHLTGPFPLSLQSWKEIRLFSLSGNAVFGDINSVFPTRDKIEHLDLTANKFTGRLGESWSNMYTIQKLVLTHNALDRTTTHTAILSPALTARAQGRVMYDASSQQDTTPPKLNSSTIIRSPVTAQIKRQLRWEEMSYPISEGGTGLAITVQGPALCSGLLLDTSYIATGGTYTGVVDLTFAPLYDGTYTCRLAVTDHGGNVGRLALTPFIFQGMCGNGTINTPETCDEGRFCDDAQECTTVSSLCPFSCATQMVDNCTPACRVSICGDSYIDADGIDNTLGTQDDEICDGGSYCSDGRSCTNNPAICYGGSADCLPRLTTSCSSVCAPSTCGDMVLDEDGVNNIVDDADDEDCDDGNALAGDGCSSSCKVEYCGDGFIDGNGADNLSGTIDDEVCDVGAGNGLRAGTCNQFCRINEQTCQWCYETCQGGTGQHSIYLLIDVSGSMEGEKMEKAKLGAKEFVQRILSGAAVNTGFVSKVGIIKFSSNGTVVQTPTTDYQQIITKIDQLVAGGSTNFGDPLYDAKSYFDTYDSGYQKHIVLLSDGLPTVGTWSLEPEEYATQAATALKNSGVSLYTIAVEQTEEGIEFMRTISSSALHNIALGKTTTQSSTQSSRSASRAIDTDKDNYTQTKNDTQAWWQIDLGTGYSLREIKLRNRSNMANSTSNAYVFASATPFTTTTISGTLAQSGVIAEYISGTVARPTILSLENKVRYIRVQLVAKNSLQLAEVEIMGCIDEKNCDFVFNFEDYTSEIISTLYGHIFGSIHCGCGPYQVCGACGDGTVDITKGELCDEGSSCDDGTDCTEDPSVCPTQCRPRTTQTCTLTCKLPFCGDAVLQVGAQEQCDDGNTQSGDGCSATCTQETCGDGLVDSNGPDNILGTTDDEQCDDTNTISGDGCASCKVEFCGDGLVGSGELCDTGRSCKDGTDCTSNPWICPGTCETRFSNGCAPDCTWGSCGDTFVDTDGSNNSSGDSDDEQCDPGKFCPSGIPCSHDESLCPGACEVQFTPTCTQYCKLTYCGDGFVDIDGVDDNMDTAYDNEQCDDGNGIHGDGCSATCLLEDDCQVGNCGSATCGDGVKQFFEACDPKDAQDPNAGSCTDACALVVCGDGIVRNNEECDGGRRCDDLVTSCTADATVCPTGPTECRVRYMQGCTEACIAGCGNGEKDVDGIDNIAGNADDEACDDGNTKTTDSCTNTCKIPSCGDGILTYYAQVPTSTGGVTVYYETCDDGNTNNDDTCPSTCIGSGTMTVGGCASDISSFALYDMTESSFATIDQLCEKGIPDGAPVYNEITKTWNWTCHGILGGADASCVIDGRACGDGVVDVRKDEKIGIEVEEQCDDGNTVSGDGCSSRCVMESPLLFTNDNVCASSSYPTIQPGELLPVRREGTMRPFLSGSCASQISNGFINASMMQCTFVVTRGTQAGAIEQVGTFSAPCLQHDNQLILDARQDMSNEFIASLLGGTILGADTISLRATDDDKTYIYGQYRLRLQAIQIDYCALTRTNINGMSSVENPVRTIHQHTYTTDVGCVGQRSLTPSYVMQQRVLFSEQPNTGLDNTILNLSGEMVYLDDSSYYATDTLPTYQGAEKAYLLETMIKKYLPLATQEIRSATLGNTDTHFTKVPNSHVYVYSDQDDLLLTQDHIIDLLTKGGVLPERVDQEPFTLLVTHPNADLHLQGDISGRGMLISKGTIRFVAENCDTQDVVQGVFVANGGFSTTPTINSDETAHQWCNGGGLVIQGMILGADIAETLGGLRRATINFRDETPSLYKTPANEQYMLEHFYLTCMDMPLLIDAIKKLMGSSLLFQGPFAGCSPTTLSDFETIRDDTEKQFIDLLFKPQGFFDKGFHEQNTTVAQSLLKLLPKQETTTLSPTKALTTTILYADRAYTLQIPLWKLQEIATQGKMLPRFWETVIDLRTDKAMHEFLTKMRASIDHLDEKMNRGEHPFVAQEGKSIHDILKTVRGTPYTTSLLTQSSAGNELCQTQQKGSDGKIYTDNTLCTLTYTPFYAALIKQHLDFNLRKQQKDTFLLEGAGVQVRSAPTLWQTPPPGARDLLQSMRISF